MSFFTVIDTHTGKTPDMEEIARMEDWARGLVWCDMEGFSVCEDGSLLLLDECGNFAYCPAGRFKVTLLPSTPLAIEVESSLMGRSH